MDGTDDGGVDVEGALLDDDGTEVTEDIDDLPLVSCAGDTGTDPKVLGTSGFMDGTAAGEEEMGADGSSIEPNVTEDPCFTDPTLFRGMLTPSLNGTL